MINGWGQLAEGFMDDIQIIIDLADKERLYTSHIQNDPNAQIYTYEDGLY